MSLATIVGGVEALLSTIGGLLVKTPEEKYLLVFVETELESVRMALNGDVTNAIDKAFDGIVLFATQEDLSKFLTDADVRRAKVVKMAADRVKFGWGEDPPITEDDGS